MPRPIDPDVDLVRKKARVLASSFSAGLGKVHSRFVADMLSGLLLSGSVRLTEVARALGEAIPEHSTHKRLSRNLGNAEVGRVVAGNLLQAAAELIDTDAVLVVDSFEIVKPYAQRMQYLAPGADSAHGRRKGYSVCEIVSWDMRGGPMPALAQAARHVASDPAAHGHRVSAWNDVVFTPVAQTLWSTRAPDSLGPTAEIVRLIRTVAAACEGRGVFNINATADTDLPHALADEALLRGARPLPAAPRRGRSWAEGSFNYVLRVAPEQPLLHRRRLRDAASIGKACTKPYGTTIYKTQDDHEESVFLQFGATPVALPTRHEHPLWLLTIESGLAAQAEQPTSYLLTNQPLRRNRAVLWRLVLSFLQYGHAVSTNRAIKHRFDFDDVRVLSYQRLRNLATLVQAAAFAEALWPGVELRERIFLEPQSRAPAFRVEPYAAAGDEQD